MHIPQFEMTYNPDERQAIANSWPQSIDDVLAAEHWGWKREYDLVTMVEDMMINLKKKYK